MPIAGGAPKVIAYVYGGQGTINVPSWSPDSKMVAFVSNTDKVLNLNSLPGRRSGSCRRQEKRYGLVRSNI